MRTYRTNYTPGGGGSAPCDLQPPVTPAEVRTYIDLIRVRLRKGLNNDQCNQLKRLILPLPARPHGRGSTRLFIQDPRKDEVCIHQPSTDELWLLQELPLAKRDPVIELELAYDFPPKPRQSKLLMDFMQRSMAFPVGLEYATHPQKRNDQQTTYEAPRGDALVPKYYFDQPCKLDPKPGGPAVPHLCFNLAPETICKMGLAGRPTAAFNFDYRAFLLKHMLLVNSDVDRLLDRARRALRERNTDRRAAGRIEMYLRAIEPDLRRPEARAQKVGLAKRVLELTHDRPYLQPERYNLLGFLPSLLRPIYLEKPAPVLSTRKPTTRKRKTSQHHVTRGTAGILEPDLSHKAIREVMKLLPKEPERARGGRPRQSMPKVIRAVAHKAQGARWKDLCVPKPTVSRYLREWKDAGLWHRMVDSGAVDQNPELACLQAVLV